jgi:hypothetical protein
MKALGTEKPLPLRHRRGGIRLAMGLDQDGEVTKRAPTIEKAMVRPWGLEPQAFPALEKGAFGGQELSVESKGLIEGAYPIPLPEPPEALKIAF